jgi:hypothetical protein
MSKTRNNHYVPQWYQRGFLEDGREKLRYLDLDPPQHTRGDGSKVKGRSLFDSTTAQCFYRTDLYSTFFGFHVDDEIERRLFGAIDQKGAAAVEAFKGEDVAKWINSFQEFFEFIDAQKLRTPKGLDWLRLHYPFLDQNQLMFEMQGVRMMNCTLWFEGVREIVSAEDSEAKFIISDHPVTTYNYAVPPGDMCCAYPNDPPIAWRATQTIFPLDRNFCLILSNLEYAQDPEATDPIRKRTNARNFRQTLVRADAFIRSRKLTADEVLQVNHVIKSRANRYLAAGREEWLFPERQVTSDWASIAETLRPPPDELWRFGGETYVSYKDGSVDYQDQFGRTEPRADFLDRRKADLPRRPRDPCGCGSGRPVKTCCAGRAPELRPSWSELSIRERNILHARAIADIVGLADGKNWAAARREFTDEKIAEIHKVFRVFWPLETDLSALLPKPDGRLRALFTGLVDPRMVTEYALGASSYFGELLIQNPFLHPAAVQEKFSPVKNPTQYRQEVLKHITLLFDMLPLIDAGVVNLFPDPCHFDLHLRYQMMHMAKARYGDVQTPEPDARARWLQRDDFQRSMWSLSERAQRSMLRKALPELGPEEVEDLIATVKAERQGDPLAPLQEDAVPDGADAGLLMCHHLTPNLEMSLYLAQATGSIIVTDSPHRWQELKDAAWYQHDRPATTLPALKALIEGAEHLYVGDQSTLREVHASSASEAYRNLIQDVVRYLRTTGGAGPKPNWESQLPKRFAAAHGALQKVLAGTGAPSLIGRVRCIIPSGGIRDNTINRLLLMSSVEHYAERVPMALFIERRDPTTYPRDHYAGWSGGRSA